MESSIETARLTFQRERRDHWQRVGGDYPEKPGATRYYHRRLEEIYRLLIPPGQRVLELGCGQGDLLAALEPAQGIGIDFAPSMVEQARQRHPNLTFICADVIEAEVAGPFDAIILSDLVDDLWDVQAILRRIRSWCGPHTRIVANAYSRLWQIPLAAARGSGMASPLLPQNWITPEDFRHLLELEGFELLRTQREVLCPIPIPLITEFFNCILARFRLFNWAAVTNVLVARHRETPAFPASRPTVSVIVPARNEAGNIADLLQRVPEMGGGTELIFVEGGSSDATYAEIDKQIGLHPERTCRLMRQPGQGKGDAVRHGFNAAAGDILMILDADMTVSPEELSRFYEALVSNHGEFINGVRLVYPMQEKAMRFFNLVGNKFFSQVFSWLLGQTIRDTLCGTKVLSRRNYAMIARNRSYFGDFDPFGDFDLLFGAAKLNLKIVGLPIRYRERSYGAPNIQRWRHGVILLRMVLFASSRLKFR